MSEAYDAALEIKSALHNLENELSCTNVLLKELIITVRQTMCEQIAMMNLAEKKQ